MQTSDLNEKSGRPMRRSPIAGDRNGLIVARISALAAIMALGFVVSAPAYAVDPPDRVNYQGVLRDASDNPRSGSVDMTFRFFDAPSAGNEILVDEHLAAGTGAVLVSDGLFDVVLGSGAVVDGAATLPGDPFTTLGAMFEAFTDVWMQVEIAAGGPPEILAPRVPVSSVPYALRATSAGVADFAQNAGTFGGLPAGSYLDTSATAQSKAGDLSVANLSAVGNLIGATATLTGGNLTLGTSGAGMSAFAGGMTMLAGINPSDSLFLRANSGADASRIDMFAAGPMNHFTADGTFNFYDLNGTSAHSLSPGGVLTSGNVTAQSGSLYLGNFESEITYGPTGLLISGADEPSDDILLKAGSLINNGLILLQGDSYLAMRSGNGEFRFIDPGDSLLATLAPDGTLSVTNDLVATGNELRFGHVGAGISATATSLLMQAGSASSDSLELRAGDDSNDGRVVIHGAGSLDLESGGGYINFKINGAVPFTTRLEPTGAFVSPEFVSTDNQFRHDSGARMTSNLTQFQLVAGDADTDDLLLSAGNGSGDGFVRINGQGGIEARHSNGAFLFTDETGTLTGSLSSSGTFFATEDLVAGSRELFLGTSGSALLQAIQGFDDLVLRRDNDNNDPDSWFRLYTNNTVEQMRIEDGDEAAALFDGVVTANGLDYAEAFSITDPTLRAGEVVVFDPARPGFIARADRPYSNLVAGVISEQPGFLTGGSFDAEEAADPVLAESMRAAYQAADFKTAREMAVVLGQRKAEQQRPVALAGRLPVMVDASYVPIHAGDHLTSSGTPGHAMAMLEAGPSIGVALESFDGPGTGTILAFVQRGHYTPSSLLAATQAAQQQLAQTVAQRTPDPVSGVQVMPADLQFVLDASGDQDSRLSVFRDGAPSEPRAEVFRVDERGDVWAHGAFRPRSMDVAETFAVSEAVGPGDVLVVDRDHPGRYTLSREAADTAVVGVVASDPGVLLGGDVSRVLDTSPDLATELAAARALNDRDAEQALWREMERRFNTAYAAVALTGTVTVKADASYGSIEPGDLLVASPTPGHAMRAVDPAAAGTVIGKALEPLSGGAGPIRMLVMLR